jgi:4-diphosphocytidyl-2C-methyl-D-erythritol kinase
VVQKNPVAGGEQHPFEKKTEEPEPENHSAKSIQLIKHVPILAGFAPTSSDSSSPVALLGAATEHG